MSYFFCLMHGVLSTEFLARSRGFKCLRFKLPPRLKTVVVISLFKRLLVGHVIQGSFDFKGGILHHGYSHGKSMACGDCWPRVFCKWGYNVFTLSRDITRSCDKGIMRIYWSKLFLVCHHADKFGDHGKFEYIFKGSCDFMSESPSW